MRPANRHPVVTLFLIFSMALALSASRLKLPTFARTSAAVQEQPVALPNNGGDTPGAVSGSGDDRSAVVRTDKMSYAPGEVIIITGSGWDPGEAVTLRLHESPATHQDRLVTAI